MTQLFVDMDGVLADFDRGYSERFGVRPSKADDNVDWKLVRNTPGFYADLPPMPDFELLWRGIAPHKPIILTGVPSSVPEALDNKRAWATKHIGPDVQMIGCLSKDKCLHGKPGDILIDDWEKYHSRWIDMGGIWITHTSAENSLTLLGMIQRLAQFETMALEGELMRFLRSPDDLRVLDDVINLSSEQS